MSIKIRCPHCEKMLTLGDDRAGKKVGCTDCEGVFLVEVVDEHNADDAEEQVKEKPRKRRRRAKKKGVPMAVWLAVGGGVSVLVLVVTLGIVLMSRSRPIVSGPTAPSTSPGPSASSAPVASPAPTASPGPHVAILEEFQICFSASADAFARANDRASVKNATLQIREQARKIEQLAGRMEAAGRVARTDIPRLKQIDAQILPAAKRIEADLPRLQKKLGTMNLDIREGADLEIAVHGWGDSVRRMKAAISMSQ